MEKIAKWIAFGALFIIPFIPLYVESSLYFPFISGKGFAFRILVEIALGAWTFLFFINKEYRPKFSWPGIAFGTLILWAFVADIFAVNPYKALWSNFERMDGWITLIHVFAFFLVTSALFTKELWKKWWRVFLLGVILVCSVGFMQLAGWFSINQGGIRVDSTFGNSIYFADYLLFAIPITLWQLLSGKKWMRWILGLFLAIEILMLFYTETRGAFIGVFVAAVVGSVWWLVAAKKHSAKYLQGGAVLVLGLLLLGGSALFFARNTALIQDNVTLRRVSSIFSPEEFKVRFTIWNMALEGAMARPVVGWGQEGFSYVFNTYYSPSMYQQEVWFDRAHNTYLDWLTAGGIPALLLFLWFLSALLWSIYRSELSKEERILFCCAVLAYGISALSVFDNLFTYVPLLAITAYVHGRIGRPLPFFEKIVVITTPAFQAVVGLIVILITFTTLWIVNVPALSAGNTLIQAMQVQPSGAAYNLALFKKALAQKTLATQEIREQLVQYTTSVIRDPSVGNDTKLAFVQLALSEMHQSLVEAPQDARLHSMMASLFAMVGDQASALSEIDTALSLSPKKQTLLLQKGMILWQFNDLKGAQSAFHSAYVLDPSFKDLAAYDAAGAIAAGDASSGFSLLQNVFGTTTVNNEALIRAYYQTGHFTELVAVARARAIVSGSVSDRLSLAVALSAAGDKVGASAELSAIETEYSDAKAQVEQVRTTLQL